jgi:hypothetical protein
MWLLTFSGREFALKSPSCAARKVMSGRLVRWGFLVPSVSVECLASPVPLAQMDELAGPASMASQALAASEVRTVFAGKMASPV